MNFRKLVFVSVVMVLILSISAASQQLSTEMYSAAEDGHKDDAGDAITMDSLGHRSLLQKKKQSRRVTCKKFPGICHAKGNPGSACCKKKCVNLLKDRKNCGKCGKKCKYNEVCCKGRCVNPSFNAQHCGGCNNRCGNGEFCVLGLCNYA